jgi:hypothetical protein
MNIIKNTLFLSLIGMMSFINCKEDIIIHLPTYKKDSSINKLHNGDNIGHMLAKECQKIHSLDQLSSRTNELFQQFFKDDIKIENLDDANPLIPNKDGKIPQQIAQQIFQETGIFSCAMISSIFDNMENELIKKLQPTHIIQYK